MINKRLKEHWDYLISLGYNEDRLLGIFACGSMNYGFFKEGVSDVDCKAIILPSFEDMCLDKEWYSKEVHHDNEHIDVKDIRYIREMFKKQNINFIEMLFTQYKIINPKYEKLFTEYFLNNRETIAHYDRQKTLNSISGQLLHTLHQDPTDRKKVYNADRLLYFLSGYLLGDNYIDCMIPKGSLHDILWELKYGDIPISSEFIEQIETAVKGMQEKYKNIDSPDHDTASSILDTGVIEILRYSFTKQESVISATEFYSHLTNAEIKAYRSIIKNIHEEGNITISKLVETNSISRPVYNNLLNKMKEDKVAEVLNMGMRGTYIKITEPELKVEAMNII
jgi:hypothetical protein